MKLQHLKRLKDWAGQAAQVAEAATEHGRTTVDVQRNQHGIKYKHDKKLVDFIFRKT